MLGLCNLNKPLMSQVNLPVVEVHVIHPHSTTFVLGVKAKALGGSKLIGNDSPEYCHLPLSRHLPPDKVGYSH